MRKAPESKTRLDLRATLAGLDERQRKIVGGVLAIMIENPARVREREWIAEQFTEIALLACGLEDVAGTQEGRKQLQAYACENIDALLNASYALFLAVAADLEPRAKAGVSREQALAHALTYLVQESPSPR